VFTSYVTLESERNLFIVQFEPTYTINQNDQLVIEIPTKSLDGRLLFANDGGLQPPVNDYDTVPFDLVDASDVYTYPMCDC
jgi:hypothetical protein